MAILDRQALNIDFTGRSDSQRRSLRKKAGKSSLESGNKEVEDPWSEDDGPFLEDNSLQTYEFSLNMEPNQAACARFVA